MHLCSIMYLYWFCFQNITADSFAFYICRCTIVHIAATFNTMPALMMKNNCNDDCIGSEFYECFNLDNTIHNLHLQINELELSEIGEFNQYEQPAGFSLPYGDLQNDAYLRTRVAGQDIKIGEGADFMDDKTFTLLKDLITKTRTSSPYYQGDHQLNSLNYVNEDGHSIPTATNPTWDLSQSCDLLDHSLTEDSVPFNVDTSAGVLTNNVTLNDFMPIDELSIMNGRYGVLPSIEKTEEGSIAINEANSFGATATMCFNNVDFSHWIDQNLTGPLPDLADLTDMYPTSNNLPKSPAPRKNVTLVLDLDETLIHSSTIDCDGADFSFPMYHGTKEHIVYVKKRPHVDTFLQKVSEMFKVVIFTASLSSYANRLLDILDPENQLISQRFFRESCVPLDGSYIKDLTYIVTDLAKVAIIDNSPEVFQLQEENGIPIKSWTSDRTDHSLFELIPFLEALAVADDVRPIIAEKLGSQRSIT
ncbi:hypothetical protein E2562_030995 [Oryza meyeriana var. granulata]|uniref:FCP1 homology domain-containing protein n=1 Tax=Oryza meyeriana var. granulata TaxID=110450 RepID=A0A6G1ERE4_9ORYZ|nr:hypothetical protein E2562_030995 [Oryza meyeriana var. granulata]